MIRALSAAASLTLALSAPAHPAGEPQDEIVYMGRAFVFEARLDEGRARGWIDAATSDHDALEGIAATLAERLVGTGRFFEGQVALEEGNRVSVTFVGHQAESVETFLKAGLSNPGRVSLAVVATEADLDGADLEEERARVERWREEHPGRSLTRFARVSRGEGGPHPRLFWLPARGAKEEGERPPVPLLRESGHLFHRSELEPERAVGVVAGERVPLALELNLREEAGDALRELTAPWLGREMALVLNDEVVRREVRSEAFGDAVVVDGDFARDEVRELLLALAGEPLDAPLRFVEFGQRELQNVKRR